MEDGRYTLEREVDLPELVERINFLCEWDALEFVRVREDLYIPYCMNDAAECYLFLSDCQVQGSLLEGEDVLEAQVLEGEGKSDTASRGRDGILLRGREGEAVTLWFSGSRIRTSLYQYHRILHPWVAGQEHLRRLVYILGTVYDKGRYLQGVARDGNALSVVSGAEAALLPLMEVRAFRFFRPAAPEYCGSYPDTSEGFATALALAREAGEGELVKALIRYQRWRWIPIPTVSRYLEVSLIHAFEEAENFASLVDERLEAASLTYPKRQYPWWQEEQMESIRQQASRYLFQRGYEGSYPFFQKSPGALQAGFDSVTAYEEHPFVAEGMDQMPFRIVFLGEKKTVCGIERGTQSFQGISEREEGKT